MFTNEETLWKGNDILESVTCTKIFDKASTDAEVSVWNEAVEVSEKCPKKWYN